MSIRDSIIRRATMRPICAQFVLALERHGIPEEILTDNDTLFTNRFGFSPTEVLFDKICRENGIVHLLTPPRTPTTTGKIERFHRSLREEFLTGKVFATLELAQKALMGVDHPSRVVDEAGRAEPPAGEH